MLDANIPHSITGGRGGFSGPTGPPDSVFGTYIFPYFSLRQVSTCVWEKKKEKKKKKTDEIDCMRVVEMGSFIHACEGEIVCQSINTKIPYFNAPIYLENKSQIGKVDEILGPLNQVFFTIKPQEGIVASSFKEGDKFYIGGDKLLPLER